ncbi:MAG: hypothetical protein KC613_16010, partial [Myxococcales bacterium]|nr:hypothetical protein [Myxococcales bacterium]
VGARDGFVGRLLHAAWAGGVLDLTVGPGGVAELPAGVGFGLFRGALGEAAEGLARDAEMVLRTRPLLPPGVTVVPDDRPLRVAIGDMLLDIEVDGRVLATVSLHLDVAVALTVVVAADGGIELEPDLAVEVWTDTAEAPVAPVDEAALEQRVATFANLLPGLIAGQTFAVGADALPIPVGLQDARVEAEDAAWLHVRADLAPP